MFKLRYIYVGEVRTLSTMNEMFCSMWSVISDVGL